MPVPRFAALTSCALYAVVKTSRTEIWSAACVTAGFSNGQN